MTSLVPKFQIQLWFMILTKIWCLQTSSSPRVNVVANILFKLTLPVLKVLQIIVIVVVKDSVLSFFLLAFVYLGKLVQDKLRGVVVGSERVFLWSVNQSKRSRAFVLLVDELLLVTWFLQEKVRLCYNFYKQTQNRRVDIVPLNLK